MPRQALMHSCSSPAVPKRRHHQRHERRQDERHHEHFEQEPENRSPLNGLLAPIDGGSFFRRLLEIR
jgi:hypothetical protein